MIYSSSAFNIPILMENLNVWHMMLGFINFMCIFVVHIVMPMPIIILIQTKCDRHYVYSTQLY
jgi:hypothetical protein